MYIIAGNNKIRQVVEKLLPLWAAEPNTSDPIGRNALLFAITDGRGDFALRLLGNRGLLDLNHRMDNGSAALHLAIIRRQFNVLRALLREQEVDVNLMDGQGRGPLILAVMGGHERAVELMLGRNDTDPTVEVKHEGESFSALDLAARSGHEGIASRLLASLPSLVSKIHYGGRLPASSPNQTHFGGRLPFDFAVSNGHGRLFKLLMPGKDARALKLLVSVSAGDLRTYMDMLEEYPSLVNEVDSFGNTLLQFAMYRSREAMAVALLKRPDLDLKLSTKYGYTALEVTPINSQEDVPVWTPTKQQLMTAGQW